MHSIAVSCCCSDGPGLFCRSSLLQRSDFQSAIHHGVQSRPQPFSAVICPTLQNTYASRCACSSEGPYRASKSFQGLCDTQLLVIGAPSECNHMLRGWLKMCLCQRLIQLHAALDGLDMLLTSAEVVTNTRAALSLTRSRSSDKSFWASTLSDAHMLPCSLQVQELPGPRAQRQAAHKAKAGRPATPSRQWCVVRPHMHEKSMWERAASEQLHRSRKRAGCASTANELKLHGPLGAANDPWQGRRPSPRWPGMVPTSITDRVGQSTRPALNRGSSHSSSTPAGRMRSARKRSMTRAWAMLMQQQGPSASIAPIKPAKGKPFNLAHAMNMELLRPRAGRKAAQKELQATTSDAAARLKQVRCCRIMAEDGIFVGCRPTSGCLNCAPLHFLDESSNHAGHLEKFVT